MYLKICWKSFSIYKVCMEGKRIGWMGAKYSHSPAPDYLRFDARLVQAAAREITLSELVEILENLFELNRFVYERNMFT